MSHFFVVVILPQKIQRENIKDQVDKQLDPFYEGEVEPYETTCYCVGREAKPDSTCETCSGIGVQTSTYNPLSKWDWWSFGGRWNGNIKNKYRGDKSGFNFDDEYRTLHENLVQVELLIKRNIVPFAILTPDGEWIDQGNMGWWAVVTDEVNPKVWERSCQKVYEKYSDCLAVGLDCHI